MPIRALASLSTRHPRTVCAVALLLAAAGGLAYAFGLEIQSNRAQLSDPDRPLNRREAAFERRFGIEDQLLLMVTAGPPDAALAAPRGPDAATAAAMRDVLAAWRSELAAAPGSFPPRPADTAGPWALLYAPDARFDRLMADLSSGVDVLAALGREPRLATLFAVLSDRISTAGPGDAYRLGTLLPPVVDGLARLAAELAADVAAEVELQDLGASFAAAAAPDGSDLTTIAVADGRLLLSPVAVRGEPNSPNEYAAAAAAARDAIARVRATGRGAGLATGIAGLPALEAEEIATSQRDFGRGAAVALLLVSLLFAVTFRSLLRPALAALCLGIALGATFLFAWIAVGHLNLIAFAFAVVLVAIGIDFAIHVAIHYERDLDELGDPGPAIGATLRRVGPAIWTGGLTTAAAFGSAVFVDAPGLSELGLIAGAGLLLCLVTMTAVYPALLLLADRSRAGARRGAEREDHRPPLRPAGRIATATAIVALAVAAVGFAFGQYRFDTDLLALQPTTGEAARWQRALLDADDRTWFAIATFEDRAALKASAVRLRAAEGLVASVATPFPADEMGRRAALAPLAARLGGFELSPDRDGTTAAERRRAARRAAFGLRLAVRSTRDADPRAATALADLAATIDAIREALDASSPERFDAVERAVLERLETARRELAALCAPPAPIDPQQVPGPLRRRHVAPDGTLALYVHPAFPVWDGAARERFVSGALALEPGLFGGIVNLHDNTAVMVESFRQSWISALVAVTALTLFGLRSGRRTALALLPLFASIGLLLLWMRFGPVEMAWNFGNFFALPILIGIGVDSGIHMTEGFLADARTYAGARRAVIVSNLTTLIGFGVLATSEHQGVRSLGLLLSHGIALVLITSLVLLPIALRAALPRARAMAA